MGLREVAEADLAEILENPDGFAWPVTVVNPSGTSLDMMGMSGDVGQLFDFDTGQAVTGRFARVSLRLSTLAAAAMGIPEGVPDPTKRPWKVTVVSIAGESMTCTVIDARPDRTLGLVSCNLQARG